MSKTLEAFGFVVIRTGNRILLARNNPDGTTAPRNGPGPPAQGPAVPPGDRAVGLSPLPISRP